MANRLFRRCRGVGLTLRLTAPDIVESLGFRNPKNIGAIPMARVRPFHSARLGSRNVYHDNDRCTEGNNIELHYRRDGTDGRPRCDHCNRLT